MGPLAAHNVQRLASHRPKGAHRRVDAARDQLFSTLMELAGLFGLAGHDPPQAPEGFLKSTLNISSALNSRDFYAIAILPQCRCSKFPSDRPSNREGISGQPWGAPGCPFIFVVCFVRCVMPGSTTLAGKMLASLRHQASRSGEDAPHPHVQNIYAYSARKCAARRPDALLVVRC